MYKFKSEQFYALLLENPNISDQEAAAKIGTTYRLINKYRHRFEDRGIIRQNADGTTTVTGKFNDDPEMPVPYKFVVYQTMVDIYLEDFKEQERFSDRVQIGREIRLLLERM